MINQKGINLENGFLRLTYNESNQPEFNLEEHSKEQYNLYKAEYSYKPELGTNIAEEIIAQTLPNCEDREVLLRTIASSFDRKKVLNHQSRLRALLLIGSGSNGKDVLGIMTKEVFSPANFTNIGTQVFADNDKGKAGLAKMRLSKINWSSENEDIDLSKSSSLKEAITGDPISVKILYKTEQETIYPNANLFFCFNELPSMSLSNRATSTRFAPIYFDQTFISTPSPSNPNEHRANPKLRDPAYLREEIIPSFLNLLISKFQDVLSDGIEYQHCDQRLLNLTESMNPLNNYANGRFIPCQHHDGISSQQIFRDYEDWCREEGYSQDHETKNSLINALKKNLLIPGEAKSRNCGGIRKYPIQFT